MSRSYFKRNGEIVNTAYLLNIPHLKALGIHRADTTN